MVGASAAGLAVLEAAQPVVFVAARARENLLGTVFGPIDEVGAQKMLEQALKQKGTQP